MTALTQIDLTQATDISARFLKVRIVTKRPSMSVGDKEAAQVAEAHVGAELGSTYRANRKLYDETLPKWQTVKSALNAVTSRHNALTSPYDETGWRLLPTVKWLDYGNEINPLITIAERAIYELSLDLDDMIETRNLVMGRAFDRTRYPDSPQAFRAMFIINPLHENIPSLEEAKQKTRKLLLPAEELEKMERALTTTYHDSLKRVTENCFNKLLDVASRFKGSIEKFAAGEQKTIKGTQLETIEATLRYAEEFNVVGDGNLAQLVADMRADLLKYSIEEVRENPAKAQEVATAASKAAERAAKRANMGQVWG